MACWGLTNNKMTTSSDSVYAGYDSTGGSPYSKAGHDWAYIGLTSAYLDRCLKIAQVFPAFVRMVDESMMVEEKHQVQNLLTRFRNVMFEWLKAAPEIDDDVYHGFKLIEELQVEEFSVSACKSAMRWGLAHELAHRLTSRNELVESGRLLLKMAGIAGSVSNRKHLLELGCDARAFTFVSESSVTSDDVMSELAGGLIGALALVWDGWFEDRSMSSVSHPSPTLRFYCLRAAWLASLNRHAKQGWIDIARPPAGAAHRIAMLFMFEQWGAGEFEPHRSGASIEERYSQFLTISSNALNVSALRERYARLKDDYSS